ncbi:MAG: 50S ribosomal protein L14e [Nanoarchaeota archaeon]|nr:50S ribosomal protein L14e [Nanoarchaeota archaeon]
MMDIGRVCIKTAGRDSGETAVVIEQIDENFVLVNGNVRRKRCNIKHLEPTEKFVMIQAGVSTEGLHQAMQDAGLEVKKKASSKEKKAAVPAPARQRKVKEQPVVKPKVKKK